MHKVFTLLSGGADSSTTLAIARQDFPDDPIECVTVDYGQRHKREMKSALMLAEHYGADHHILDLSGLLTGMLVDKGEHNDAIPDVSYAELPTGISPTYVSFRNGTMLSLLAARAQAWVMQEERDNQTRAPEYRAQHEPTATLYCGVHADDGVNWAYPDCSPEFIGSMAAAIHVGTYFKVRLRAPLQYMNKVDVVRTGYHLDVPFEYTWSCYKGEEIHCGICPTCRSRKDAFTQLGLCDHDVQYASDQKELVA